MGTSSGGRPIVMPAQPGMVGRRLGRYEILHRLAAGGMATVYVARGQGVAGFERLVAIKLLHPHLAHEEEFVSMFLDEARLAARVHHSNVVGTLDISDSGGDGYFLVMEYVDGTPLTKLIANAAKDNERLPPPVVARIILDVLTGLDAAHNATDERGRPMNLVHRDISPQNVLLGTDGIARITDFGVAKAEARVTNTREGVLKGKLGYMAPEQISEGESDRRSDLWSVGVMLWEAMVGRRLFRGETDGASMHQILASAVPRVATVRAELAPYDLVISRALTVSRAERYQTAAEFVEALEAAAHQAGGIAQSRVVGEQVRRRLADQIATTSRAIQGAIAAIESGTVSPDTDFAQLTPSEPGGAYVQNSSLVSMPMRRDTTMHTGVARFEAQTKRSSPTLLLVAIGVVCMLAAAVVVALRFVVRPSAPTVTQAAPATVNPPAPVDSTALEATALVGQSDHQPELLDGQPPVLTDPTMALTPTIVCRLHVDTSGHVVESRIYRSRADLASLEPVALAAVQHYRFSPARHAGLPVPVWINLPVTFVRTQATAFVHIKGSDTIGSALGPDLARQYEATHPGLHVTVEALGSATAFVGLFDGSADIGASSRPVNASELDDARRLNVTLQEFVIGYDGIAVIVHPSNHVSHLTLDQLAGIFSGQVANWTDVGGAAAPIRLFGRPSYSGTHAFFLEKVVRHSNAHGPEQFAAGITPLEHNEDIIRAVASDPNAMAYVPFGFVTPGVHAVAVASAAAPIAPNAASIQDGTYPVCRPLLMYTRGHPRGDVANFLRFALSAEGRNLVTQHGFVPSDIPMESALGGAASGGEEAARIEPAHVPFDEGSTHLAHAARSQLDTLAAIIMRQRYTATIIGNSDSPGDVAENLRISTARAHAVSDYLIRQGVPAESIHVDPGSSDRPLATNTTAEGRSLNRRVDVLLSAPR